MSAPLVAVPVFFVVAVLFGANPVNQLWGTLLWAVLISALVLLPAHLLLKDAHHWFKVVVRSRLISSSERLFCYGSLTTLCGTWLGALPILLDWNRSWQVWPIPSCIGAIIGSLVGYAGYGTIQYWYHSRRKHSSV